MKLHQNSIMFTHNDLDGIGGGILFKAALGSTAEVHYCGYHNVDEKINNRLDEIEKTSKELPFIVVADLGIKPETAERLNNYQGGKRWLDHHKTNIDIASKYDWATIDIEACGTLLVFDEFEEIPRKFTDFALHVNSYDLWIHDLPKAKDLNRLYFLIGIERFEARMLENEKIEFTESEQLLLEIEEQKIDRYISKLERAVKVYELQGDKQFGIVFADQYQSEAAHELLERLELDAIALIDGNSKKISLRSVPNFDVGSIAKRLGGGGHKNAAGVEFNYKHVKDFHGNKSLFGMKEGLDGMFTSLYMKVAFAFEAIENEAIGSLFGGVE